MSEPNKKTRGHSQFTGGTHVAQGEYSGAFFSMASPALGGRLRGASFARLDFEPGLCQ